MHCCGNLREALHRQEGMHSHLALSWQAVFAVAQVALLVLLAAQLARDEGGQARLHCIVVRRVHLQQIPSPKAQLQVRWGPQALQPPLQQAQYRIFNVSDINPF